MGDSSGVGEGIERVPRDVGGGPVGCTFGGGEDVDEVGSTMANPFIALAMLPPRGVGGGAEPRVLEPLSIL